MTKIEEIETQAREWSVILSSDEVDKEILEKFKQWRQSDPRHAEIFVAEDRIWQGMQSMEHLRHLAKLPEPQNSEQKPNGFQRLIDYARNGFEQFIEHLIRPQGMVVGAAFALVLAVGIALLMPQNIKMDNAVSAAYSTSHGEVKTFTLEDGSIITLKPESSILVAYAQEKRAIRLKSGGALFDVTNNPDRPFTVMTGTTETRVLGTVFSVERRSQDVAVSVKEGKVRVGKPISQKVASVDTEHEILTVGHKVTASLDGKIRDRTEIDPETVGSWKLGKLTFQNASLKEIISEANRYYDKKILLADKQTEALRISIAFKTDNIDQLIDNLAEALPLDVNRELPGSVVLQIEN